MTKIISVVTAVLSVLLSCTPFSAFFRDKTTEHRYIIIQDAVDADTISYMKNTFGENNPENEVLYAMGVCGPMLLTDSPEVIAEKTNRAFEEAVKNNIPVWFQIDDVNNHNYAYLGPDTVTCEKWYENEENVEKLGFGENAKPAAYWFNWGKWKTTPAMPCLNSPTFVEFVDSQLSKGFIPALQKWLAELKQQNKEYLFAGVSVGWETRIPDYSDIPLGTKDQTGREITAEEQNETGYRALENLGYTAEKLKTEADSQGISEKLLMYHILCQVEHDYSQMISKKIYDAGVEKTKIFTHYTINENRKTTDDSLNYNFPEVSTAINDYSTPGFTIGVDPSKKLVCTLKMKIAMSDPQQSHFGAVEGYAYGLNDNKKDSVDYFRMLFNSGALVVAVYGIHDAPSSVFYIPREYDKPFNQAVRYLIGNK